MERIDKEAKTRYEAIVKHEKDLQAMAKANNARIPNGATGHMNKRNNRSKLFSGLPN